jgi:N-formylglutamate amidohydrolase
LTSRTSKSSGEAGGSKESSALATIVDEEIKRQYADMLREQRRSAQLYEWLFGPRTFREQVLKQLHFTTPIEDLKFRIKRLWRTYHPVVMTARKRDELGSSDW